VLHEGAKWIGGLLAIFVVAGESSFASVEITKHVTASNTHALEAQLAAARKQVTAEGVQVNAARAQVNAERAQVNTARVQMKAALAQAAAASAQTLALRSHTALAEAQDAANRLGKMQREVAQTASTPRAQRCLHHVLKHEMRQRRDPDTLFLRHDYTAAARGYNSVAARLALKATRCDKGIRLTIGQTPTRRR
jgi:2C-methyl-D-erythritol 2,4-cyclodiphosphate synthase